jgi:predicted FMN-binding regulatory protein PaiB
MKDLQETIQSDPRELEDLYESQSTCLLVTEGSEGAGIGVFNPIRLNGKFYLHLGRHDKQVKDLRFKAKAKVVFQDILAVIPSYWVDENYAGAATTYYRYAELDCRVRILDTPEGQLPIYEGLMRKFQPEGRFEKLDPESPIYEQSFRSLVVLELDVEQVRSKWKLGQNRPVETRLRVAQELEKRARGADLRAAAEIRKWIDRSASRA